MSNMIKNINICGFRNLLVLFICLSLLPQIVLSQTKEPGAEKTTQKASKVLYGIASFYANKFDGRKTANGEIFSQKKFTAACNVLPLGTWVKVTNLRNGKSVVLKTNDRLHPSMKRILDLSRAAAQKLGYINSGLTRVKVEIFGKKKPSI